MTYKSTFRILSMAKTLKKKIHNHGLIDIKIKKKTIFYMLVLKKENNNNNNNWIIKSFLDFLLYYSITWTLKTVHHKGW